VRRHERLIPSNVRNLSVSDPTPLRRLAWLISDPDENPRIPPEEIPELLGALEELKARLWSRLAAPSLPPRATEAPRQRDRLLNAREAGERIGVNAKWMYSHADTLPFTHRLGKRTLRFSEFGLAQWMEDRKMI
jgi:predicted DNA-binding transcriptional regulator AlpA